MKYTIEAIENAKPEMRLKDIGCHWNLVRAYLYSEEAGNELPNFSDAIWDTEIEDIVSDCRKFGVKEFTVSSTFSGLIEVLEKFEELGCTLDGIVKIKQRGTFDTYGNLCTTPAFKMTVK